MERSEFGNDWNFERTLVWYIIKAMYQNLIKILTAANLIARTQGATVADLMNELGVSRRTVYRLVEALNSLGYLCDEKHDGHERRIRFRNESSAIKRWMPVPRTNLRFEDRVMLDFLFRSADKTTALQEQINGLRERLGLLMTEAGYIIPAEAADTKVELKKPAVLLKTIPIGKKISELAAKHITLLFQSIKESSVCIVTYEAMYNGERKQYKICPLAVFEHAGGIYVYVSVPKRENIITLALERIREIELTEEDFTPPVGFDPAKRLSDPFGIILSEPFIARIRFNADQARYIKERSWPEGTDLQDIDDGGIVMTIETAGDFELKRWVLSFGSAAELLDPEKLRMEIAEEYRKGTELYS
jgi:predicted DNA-binding transcriptional regulator YafY